uniref:(California timema) hypothetical protein n=1 Tax=Timema californicum TaxID=61474 RepID=A0A7R9J3F1_TIMCA|nr:unnamed protein product [Timema californicum]
MLSLTAEDGEFEVRISVGEYTCVTPADTILATMDISLSALPDMFNAGEPIKSLNQPSHIGAHAHLSTHVLYSQKRADSFLVCCEDI